MMKDGAAPPLRPRRAGSANFRAGSGVQRVWSGCCAPTWAGPGCCSTLVIAVAGLGAGGSAKQSYAVHKLTRGVGDTWFHTADGQRWFRLDEQRHDVPIAAISPHLQHAFVAVEDHRFFRHPGVDPIAVARAVVRNARAPGTVEGGSTITQQLARTLFLSNRRSYLRKGREAVLSVLIEAQLTKEQILELYLNRIYLSAGVYGVEAMSQRVFGKPPRTLTIAESALIAGLARAPATLSPWSNLDGAIARSHVVLARMREAGFIDAAEEREARRARVPRPPVSQRRAPAATATPRPTCASASATSSAATIRPTGASTPPSSRRCRTPPRPPSTRGLGRLGTPRTAGGAGRPRSAHRQRAGAGRRPRLPALGLQPRQPQPPSARVGLQAVRLRRGARARLVAGVDADRARSALPPQGPDEWTPRNVRDDAPDALTLRAALLESNNRAATLLQQQIGSRRVLALAVAGRPRRICPTCRRWRSAPAWSRRWR